MILEELVLHNFGCYQGRQVIDLSTTPKRPVVLVGGLNGVGKTTFLEAVRLCLYGALGAPPNRGSGGYGGYLARVVHRGVDLRDGAAIELKFRSHFEGEEMEYLLHRSWKKQGSTMKETFEVIKGDGVDKVLTEAWPEFVEAVIPRGVADLFFFDGERIEALADLENSCRVLSTALGALLGLDLVDQLLADLVVLERRKRIKAADPALKAKLDAKGAELTALKDQEEKARQEAAGAEAEVGRLEAQLALAEDRFRHQGGQVFEDREPLERRRAELIGQVGQLEEELRHMAAGLAPLLMVRRRFAEAVEQAEVERRDDEDGLLAKVLGERDAVTVAWMRELDAPSELVDAMAGFLELDRSQRSSSDVSHIVDLPDEALGAVQSQLRTVLPQEQGRLGEVMTALAVTREELDAADRALATLPDEDAIALVLKEREDARRRLAEAQGRRAAAQEAHSQLLAQLERKETEYASLLESETREALDAEDAGRLLRHSERARQTLERFQVEARGRHLKRIEGLAMESLCQLLRKDRLVSDMKIDPVSLEVRLAGSDGAELLPQQLSAGERQLLSVAMLWGMARASGKPLPVMIDTPLGRLDSTHRDRLIQRYFPAASHQVVLLSTDEEVDERAWEALKPFVAHAYTLEHSSDGTNVVPGYFWE